MPGKRVGLSRGGIVALALAVVLAAAGPALAREAAAAYDMPAQPLSEALELLSRKAGFHVNYDERLARGRQAGAVSGAETPHEALDQLLAGTGLAARFTRRDAFTIVPRTENERPDLRLDDLVITAPVIGEAKGVDYAWYGGLLLQECFRKLRGQGALKGRRYELQIYVWLDPDGAVSRLETVGMADQDETRRLIEEALVGLRLRALPPQAMPQPVRLSISAM